MHITVCLVLAWTLIYLCVMKGIKSSGKVSISIFIDFIGESIVFKLIFLGYVLDCYFPLFGHYRFLVQIINVGRSFGWIDLHVHSRCKF